MDKCLTNEARFHESIKHAIMDHLSTPGGRYLIVKGRLWRRTNPNLPDERREALVKELMNARRAIGEIGQHQTGGALRPFRARVNAAKIALGERGPVWWTDGTADFNRHLVKNSPYAYWYQAQVAGAAVEREAGPMA
jgi:hypothetical protein